METKQMINEALGGAVLKSAPTGAVAIAAVWGVALADWTMIVAITVGVMQIIYTGISTYVKWSNRNKRWTDEQG